ncbi:MAG: PIN domain-containing protein [Candidatus Hydrothermarchaeaceae archaeon]
MRKQAKDTRTFLIDTNVFVSAVKRPRKGGALNLLLKIIGEPTIHLVGNDLLVEEMLRYAQLLRSETALAIVSTLLTKMEIVEVKENYRRACKPYISTPDRADILHAATCLQTDSILITNDRHFDKINDAGVVEVWDITRAIKNLD